MTYLKVVMVVEPDHETRVIARRVFEDAGFYVLSAIKGADAINLLMNSTRPSAIFVATQLVVMTGEEFMEKLKAISDYADIPVVQMKTEHENTIIGASATVLKPLKMEDLLGSLK